MRNPEQPPVEGRAESRPPAASELGTAELIQHASQQLADLMRAELRLAATEAKDKGKQAGVGAGLLGSAGLAAGYGVAALVAAVIAALALVLPVWAAALIVAAISLAVAAGLAITGRKRVAHNVPPMPEQALDSAKQDITEIKERAQR
jgi:Flp pilus assembly protein TadB